MNFYGMSVYVSPDRPKMTLSDQVPVTKEFREDFDRWLLDFFGVTNDISDDEVVTSGHRMYVNPRTYARMHTLPGAKFNCVRR